MPTRLPLHAWGLSATEAVALQKQLRACLIDCPLPESVRTVAGADISYDKGSDQLYAAVIVLRLPEMEVVEEASVIETSRFPYVPGLLSFREAPPLISAFEKLKRAPDVLMVDGQGRAHPRGLGIAAHLGLWFDIPSVGCGKSRLCGHHDEPGPDPGDRAPLLYCGETIGVALRTKRRTNCLYISPGHRANLEDSVRLTLACTRGYRLPEPTRQAHRLVNRLRTAGRAL